MQKQLCLYPELSFMKKTHVILLHLLYFFYLFGWDEVSRALFNPNFHFTIQRITGPLALSSYILFPGSFYINYLLVMPSFFKQKKYVKLGLSWLLLVAVFILFRYTFEEVLFLKWFGIKNYTDGTTLTYYISDNFFICTGILTMSTVFWTIKHLIESDKANAVLAQQKQQAEVSFLRNQVNPHFIFNTMNNIYAMVSQQSAQALPAIEKLSGIMRYVMSESDVEQIALNKEIAYIHNFIELQTIRIKTANTVQFSITGQTDGWYIAPLLLIPFVENGFKHGVTSKQDQPFIIDLSVQNNTLSFKATNYINQGIKDESNGIGLRNVQKRLQLLYPGKHTLLINETDGVFTALLTIAL